MKISIITVSLNSSSTIADTLQSVSSQNYLDVEHIIIDGGSTDKTAEIVNRFPHISTFVSEKDNGIYDAMNKGIALASGDIIGILNADDIYVDHNVLQKVVKLFVDETIDAVYANLVFVDQFDTTQIKRYWKSGLFNKRNFYFGWMPPHPTFFVRREIYEKFGFFNTFLTSAADYELMLRFLLKNNITPRYLPEVIVRMRTGGKSTASLKNRLTANKEDRLAWKINGLKPQFFTLILKPLRKIKQFITYE